MANQIKNIIPVERLLQNNDRALLLKYIRSEIVRYETHEKSYARKEGK